MIATYWEIYTNIAGIFLIYVLVTAATKGATDMDWKESFGFAALVSVLITAVDFLIWAAYNGY